MKRWSLLPLLAILLVFGKINFSQGQNIDPCTITPSGPTPEMALQLEEDGFEQPVFITHAGDGSGRLFIVDQPGQIWIVKDSFTFPQPFLDKENTLVIYFFSA